MTNHQDPVDDLIERLRKVVELSDLYPDEVAAVREAASRLEAAEAVLSGEGYVYFNEDSGEEYSPSHPVESGECPDATDVRRSTGQEDHLNASLQTEFTARLAAEAEVARMREMLSEKPEWLDDDDLSDAFHAELKRQRAFSIEKHGFVALGTAPFQSIIWDALRRTALGTSS